VVSIYYYISVIKMMVVKEPQESLLNVVKAYPAINRNPLGCSRFAGCPGRPCVCLNAVGGVLSKSPLQLGPNGASPVRRCCRKAIALGSATVAALGMTTNRRGLPVHHGPPLEPWPTQPHQQVYGSGDTEFAPSTI